MALTKCKECGEEISKKAEKCPKCGAPRKKKTSWFTWMVTAVVALWGIGYISGGDTPSAGANKGPSPKELALKNTELDFSWSKSGFGSVMEADFTIKNNSQYDVKDVEIECAHYAKSGTRIDSNTRTIYEVVKSKGSKTFNKFNMGLIHSQVYQSSCRISNLVAL